MPADAVADGGLGAHDAFLARAVVVGVGCDAKLVGGGLNGLMCGPRRSPRQLAAARPGRANRRRPARNVPSAERSAERPGNSSHDCRADPRYVIERLAAHENQAIALEPPKACRAALNAAVRVFPQAGTVTPIGGRIIDQQTEATESARPSTGGARLQEQDPPFWIFGRRGQRAPADPAPTMMKS